MTHGHVIRRGAKRFHHCRGCKRDTAQQLVLSENGYPQGRTVETYVCTTCDLLILSMGSQETGVPDVEGLVVWVIGEWRRKRRGIEASVGAGGVTAHYGEASRDLTSSARASRETDRWLDLEDLHLTLYAQMPTVWRKWDPSRGVPFRAYAVGELRNDLKDWLRTQVGRDRPKPFADAVALDELRGAAGDRDDDADADAGGGLEAVVGGALDADPHWTLDLERVVVLRDRELAELDRKYGLRADA